MPRLICPGVVCRGTLTASPRMVIRRISAAEAPREDETKKAPENPGFENAGTDSEAAAFPGVATAYPAWPPREKRVIRLEDRVLNCFMRSMNGVRPPNDSEDSIAVTAYITWLSSGERIATNPQVPLGPQHVPPLDIDLKSADAGRGKTLYVDHCASCHGGNGLRVEAGPPMWDEMPYKDGAALSRNDKLAAWLVVAMPLDDTFLTEQEVLGIAAFVNSHPRPKLVLQENLPKPSVWASITPRISTAAGLNDAPKLNMNDYVVSWQWCECLCDPRVA